MEWYLFEGGLVYHYNSNSTLIWWRVTVYYSSIADPNPDPSRNPKAKPIRHNQSTIWLLAVVPLSRTQCALTIVSNNVLNSTAFLYT